MENTTTEPVTVDSTTLREVAYQRDQQLLILTFVSGAVYEYAAVPENVAQELIDAESKGRYFNDRIRDRYRFAHRA